jgi:hypothetical protein
MRCGEKKGKLRADIDISTLHVQDSSYALSLASSARLASAPPRNAAFVQPIHK